MKKKVDRCFLKVAVAYSQNTNQGIYEKDMKISELQLCITAWMFLTMLSERSQTQKNTYYIIQCI